MSHMASIALISTGGTIEKTYHEFEGIMSNRISVLDIMLSGLQLTGIEQSLQVKSVYPLHHHHLDAAEFDEIDDVEQMVLL